MGSGIQKIPKTGKGSLMVLREFEGEAAVLIEVGFISNQQDLERIQTNYKAIGTEIADGICEYLKK